MVIGVRPAKRGDGGIGPAVRIEGLWGAVGWRVPAKPVGLTAEGGAGSGRECAASGSGSDGGGRGGLVGRSGEAERVALGSAGGVLARGEGG